MRIFSRSLCLYRYLAPPCTSNHIKVENLRNFRRFSSFVLNFVFYFRLRPLAVYRYGFGAQTKISALNGASPKRGLALKFSKPLLGTVFFAFLNFNDSAPFIFLRHIPRANSSLVTQTKIGGSTEPPIFFYFLANPREISCFRDIINGLVLPCFEG